MGGLLCLVIGYCLSRLILVPRECSVEPFNYIFHTVDVNSGRFGPFRYIVIRFKPAAKMAAHRDLTPIMQAFRNFISRVCILIQYICLLTIAHALTTFYGIK